MPLLLMPFAFLKLAVNPETLDRTAVSVLRHFFCKSDRSSAYLVYACALSLSCSIFSSVLCFACVTPPLSLRHNYQACSQSISADYLHTLSIFLTPALLPKMLLLSFCMILLPYLPSFSSYQRFLKEFSQASCSSLCAVRKSW